MLFYESALSRLKEYAPRVVKSQTLDGGVVYDHRGMITADREFVIKAINLTQTQVEAIEELIENETYVNLSCTEGFFEGVIARSTMDNGELDMDFWVYVPPAETASNTKRMFVHEDLRITEDITVSLS